MYLQQHSEKDILDISCDGCPTFKSLNSAISPPATMNRTKNGNFFGTMIRIDNVTKEHEGDYVCTFLTENGVFTRALFPLQTMERSTSLPQKRNPSIIIIGVVAITAALALGLLLLFYYLRRRRVIEENM